MTKSDILIASWFIAFATLVIVGVALPSGMMGELFAYPLLMLMAFVCWVVAREQNEKRRVKEAREYLAAIRGAE